MARKRVLEDHKYRGKILVPPFIHQMGPLNEISWVKTMLPEFLWIALIQSYYGHSKGVELITSLTRLALKCAPSEKKRMFPTISSFGELTTGQQSCLQKELAASGDLFEIQRALSPLIAFYPECPLRFLYSHTASSSDGTEQSLKSLKTVVEGLYDKISGDTTMVQATAIWIAFDSGALKVRKGLALASFPEIEKYPHTELSQKVAASIRSSLHMFFSEPHYPVSSEWPLYFWNQGLKIDPCYIEEISDE